jgi:hypothetical protein
MKAGLIKLISEVKKQLKRIEAQIETEKRIHDAWTKYVDCEIKTVVIHQSIGVIRGLEIAKESLEYILNHADPMKDQMTTDEWLLHDQKMKRIAEQVDNRGGMVKPPKYGQVNIPPIQGNIFAPVTGDPLAPQFGFPGMTKEEMEKRLDDGMAGRL